MQLPAGSTRELDFVPVAECDAASAEAMRAMRNDPRVRGFLFTDHEVTADEHAAWLASHRNGSRPPYFAAFADGQLVGTIGITALDAERHIAEWGFYVDPGRRRQGIATAMWTRFLDRAFGELGVRTLVGEVLENNDASIALHRRFGFRQVAGERMCPRRDGSAVRVLRFELTRDPERTGARQTGNDRMEKDTAYYMDLIDRIEAIRGKNNKNWMDLLRLAFRHAPREAAAIMAEIYRADSDISDLARKLTQ